MDIREKLFLKVKDNINKYNMISKGDVVCIGLSGGADSVTLLHLLYSLQDEFGFKLIAAHINHGIRKEASKDARFCKELCEKLNIEFHLKEVDIKVIAKEYKMGEEEAGRFIRYDFFNNLVGETGKIATAHNKNDNVETLLMRLIRGTGINGLGGISFVNKNIIRPILNITREDIEKYINFCHLDYVSDKTNFEDIYTRNKVRLNIIPYIKQNLNKNVINTIGDNIIQYREDADCLSQLAADIYNSLVLRNDNKLSISISELKKNHISIQKRIIIKLVEDIKDDFKDIATSKNIDNILDLLNKENGKSFKLKEIKFYIENEYLIALKTNKMHNKKYKFQMKKCTKEIPIINNEYVCYIPYEENLENRLVFRTRNSGDIVRIDNNKHKKLTSFLSDKKVPKEQREHIQVVELHGEIIMIPGVFSSRYEKRIGEFLKIEVIS